MKPFLVQLRSINPAANRNRVYRMRYDQTLFGPALIIEWGRAGSHLKSRTIFHPRPERVLDIVKNTILQKCTKGKIGNRYRITEQMPKSVFVRSDLAIKLSSRPAKPKPSSTSLDGSADAE